MRLASGDTQRTESSGGTYGHGNILAAGRGPRAERGSRVSGVPVLRPSSIDELRAIMHPSVRHGGPLRPRGAGSSAAPCSAAEGGTVIDTTALDAILDLDEETVTVQAGLRLQRLAGHLAAEGLELAGGHDLPGRTVGGAVAGACLGPGTGDGTRLFSSQVSRLRILTPEGRDLEVDTARPHLLDMIRLSYGLLGVVHEVTLRVRPMNPFTIRRRRCTTAQFAAVADRLLRSRLGIRFYLLPFRDRVYLELRRNGDEDTQINRLLGRIRDWGESTVFPAMASSMSRMVPIAGLRYGVIDRIADAGQGLFTAPAQSGMVAPADGKSVRSNGAGDQLQHSSWCFPAAEFPLAVQAYREFCRDYYSRTRFRCDLPTVGYRLNQDPSALLSPSFDGPVFVLRAATTPHRQWHDFVLEFAEFAEKWNGSPFLDQTDGLSPYQVTAALGSRLEFFRKMRRRLDPEDRMLNPYLAQFFL